MPRYFFGRPSLSLHQKVWQKKSYAPGLLVAQKTQRSNTYFPGKKLLKKDLCKIVTYDLLWLSSQYQQL